MKVNNQKNNHEWNNCENNQKNNHEWNNRENNHQHNHRNKGVRNVLQDEQELARGRREAQGGGG